MKYTNQIVILLSSFAFLGLTTNAYSNPQSAHGDLSEDMSSISKPLHPITAPKPETKYAMKIIKPSPGYDCKIVRVTPDPDINYMIRNVGPEPRDPFIGRDIGP